MLQRILFSPYSWLIQPFSRFMMLMIPLVYLYFGWQPLNVNSSAGLISFQFPLFLLYFFSMRFLTGRKYVPILSSAVNVFGMFRLFPVVLSSLIKPFGVPFRVTPKGNASRGGRDNYVLAASGIVMFLSFFGLVMNLIPEYRVIRETGFFHYVVFWTAFNIFLLAFSLLLCFDAPKRHREEMFSVRETLNFNGRLCAMSGLSLEGALIAERLPDSQSGEISIAGVSSVLSVCSERSEEETFLRFSGLTKEQRKELILKLFSGAYDNEIHESGATRLIVKKLFREAFLKKG